jgi:hypothetical protein
VSPETFVEKIMLATGVRIVVLSVAVVAKSIAPPRIRLPIDRGLQRFTDTMIGILDGTARGMAVVTVLCMISILLVAVMVVAFGVSPK